MEITTKISIIVPVYNTGKYLRECIDSLVSQSLQGIEIVLVNDGSTDGSGQICDEFAKKYANVKVLHQANAGQSNARNNGLKVSSGQYVMFVDSDDYIISDACERLYNLATKFDTDVIWGDCTTSKKCTGDFYDKIYNANEYLKCSLKNNNYDIVPFLKMVKRESILKNDLFFIEGCFYEDQLYTMKMVLCKDLTIYRTYFPFYYYRSNPSSTTHVHNLKKGIDFVCVIHEMSKCADSVDSELKPYAEAVVAMAFYHLSNVYFRMTTVNRRKMDKQISAHLKRIGVKTKLLSKRLKVQNFLFAYMRPFFTFGMKLLQKRKGE